MGFDVFFDAAAADFFDVLDGCDVDAIGVIDIAAGVGAGDDLGTQGLGFSMA